MKFTATILTSAIVASTYALAAPQELAPASSSMSSMSTATSMTSATSTAPMTPQQTCLSRCNLGDVNCQASCVTVPSPNEAQVNQTTQCAANCKQGSGSPEDTDAYSRCQQSCISSFFITTNTGVATMMPSGTGSTMSARTTGTATSGTASASGSSATSGSSSSGSSSGTASRSGSGTATGTAATTTSTGAAGKLQLGSSLAGVAGLFVAVIAL